MKRKSIFLLTVAMISFSSLLLAQDTSRDESVPEGMERVKVGRGSEVVVPSGMKMHKVGDLVVLENPGEYVARRIGEMDGRLRKMEAREEELAARVEKLEAVITEMQKKVPEPQKEEKK
jgi:hypothetical protein